MEHNTKHSKEFKELLLKNLPSHIKGGSDKHNSNRDSYKSKEALEECNFINFNNKDRISFLIFDIDEFDGKTALEHFKTIDNLFDYIVNTIYLVPTYILQTTKGYHFGFDLKNPVYTKQEKPLQLVKDIKYAITDILQCDKIASHRLWGVYRNPLKHPCYYSQHTNYTLEHFNEILKDREFMSSNSNSSTYKNIVVNKKSLITGNRNQGLFTYGMRYACDKPNITKDEIYRYLTNINTDIEKPLINEEINTITISVFKYWENGNIKLKKPQKEKSINEGAMNFLKMKNLTTEDYEIETKRRQKLSAKRTIDIRDKEKNKKQLKKARENYIAKQNLYNKKKVLDAVLYFMENDMKINVSRISKHLRLDRRIVKRYFI